MIEHRKRQKAALLNQQKNQLQGGTLPKKPSSSSSSKRQTGRPTRVTISNGNLSQASTSIANLRPFSFPGEIDSIGISDSLPRRKPSSTSSFPIPPPLPPPRPTISHSKSLTAVASNTLESHKICTEV